MNEIMDIRTKRTSNYVDNNDKLYAAFGDVTIYADKVSGYVYEGEYDPEIGQYLDEYQPDFYTLTSHQGMMPAFHSEEFDTIEELCQRMKEHTGDLRKWCKVPEGHHS